MTIDVRSEEMFCAGHAPSAYGIPLEELAARTHELPAREVALQVADPDAGRARRAAEFLRRRGHLVIVLNWNAQSCTESGPPKVRPWQPSPFLVEALSAIRAGQNDPAPGGSPRALDVACGSGRDSVYLALKGYAVDAIDMLPDALSRARDLAARCGVAIRTIARDLEREPSLAPGGYDLVIVFRYLQRALFDELREAVLPGGYVVYETFHERTRQTGRRPSSPAHLLQSGELASAFNGFDILILRDAFERDGRFFSSLLARRRP